MMEDPKILANGQLPNTKTTAYTVPTGLATILSFLSLVNTDTGAVTCNVYAKKSGGGTSRRIIAKDKSLAANEHYQAPVSGLALAAGDVIEWDASVADKIDAVLGGTEIMAQ